jgi:hypothetical protein
VKLKATALPAGVLYDSTKKRATGPTRTGHYQQTSFRQDIFVNFQAFTSTLTKCLRTQQKLFFHSGVAIHFQYDYGLLWFGDFGSEFGENRNQ